jgi:2,3-bisphosphoglycerate-independent phosphoglycerate mutase
MRIHPSVSYRNILIDVYNRDHGGRDHSQLVTTPPHDIPGRPLSRHLPAGGPTAAMFRELIHASADLFAQHEVNKARRELGESPATHVWPWGQGRMPAMPEFKSKFGLEGAMITAVDLLAGLARLIGWQRIDAPGQTSYHDTDYAAAGRAAIEALDRVDLVCVHVEAPDEASHGADPATKIASIEAVDRHVVGPVREALDAREAPWRMLYLPDHYTRCDTRRHDPAPVPFAMCGHRVRGVVAHPFTEAHAAAADLSIKHGHELMEYFLYSGLN